MPTDGDGPLPARARGFLASPLNEQSAWAALLDAPVPTAAATADNRLVFLNAAFLELLRFPLDQLIGDGWLSACFPDPASAAFARSLIAETLSSPVTTRHRIEVMCGDGQRRGLDLTSTSVGLPDGTQLAMTIAVEVAQRPAPPASASSDRGYPELVESSPDVHLRLRPDGRFSFVSHAIERLTGHPPERFYADPQLWPRLIAPEYRAIWDNAVSQVQKGNTRAFDLGLDVPDGERTRHLILNQTLYPIRDENGQVRALEGTARDNTAVRQVEALKARNEERASLDRLKSQLLANVSHELRTPLVSIKGYNELLLRGALGPLTPRQRRGLEIAGANTDRLIELIEALLDFEKRESGRLELKTAHVDLREAVKDAVSALHDRIASRALELQVELPPVPLTVLGDRARLAQVFRALLGNAEKFSEGAAKEIVVAARQSADGVEVSVTDRGIGIPAELQQRVFDRFYQVDASSTRRFGGAGVGLAMAKELVAMHGGEITVQSAPGEGSTFTVRLPRESRPERAQVVEMRQVVLVGADEAAAEELRPLFESEALQPIDVFWAPTEVEAARRARRHRPDLVVLGFPKVDALIDELKRDVDTSSLPVVVVTPPGAGGRRPILRADLVTDWRDTQRLLAGMRRLLGRAAAVATPRAPRVVIVEDELEILDFTRFVLEREGYDVTCLTSGQEALRKVSPETDLCILDIALEESDGLDICRTLKSQPQTRDVPILIMTAMSGEDVRQGSLGAGADGYLMKPFGVDEFLRQVKLHLRAPGFGEIAQKSVS
jgi:signal transduction histidine kinase/DNA-binding response OmpR family regulator